MSVNTLLRVMGCTHPDGHRCEAEGEGHINHYARVDGQFVYWYDPPPTLTHNASKKQHTTEQMVAMVHQLSNTPPERLFRLGDPTTSVKSAKKLRTKSQKHMLLLVYAGAPDGLTDDEAAAGAGLLTKPGCCWWHRCSDLREDGFIVDTGVVRPSPTTGEERMVCIITEAGRAAL